jgi:hypothetical protein
MDPERRLELITLLAADRAWDAVVLIGKAILEEYYPESVFDGSSGDSGPDYIVALRHALNRIEATKVEAALLEALGKDHPGVIA